MEWLNQILNEHQALVERFEKSRAKSKLTGEIERFVKKVQAAGAKAQDSRTRNVLRSLLRYWAGHLYELTGSYPRLELQPYVAAEATEGVEAPWLKAAPASSPWRWWLVGLVVVVILLGAAGFLLWFPWPERPYITPSPSPTSPSVMLTPTPTPVPTPYITPSPSPTSPSGMTVPTPTLTPAPTPTISIQQIKPGVLVAEAPIRVTPDEKSPEIFLVSRNLLVEIVGEKDGWLRIRFGDLEGWVPAKYVQKLSKPVFIVVKTPVVNPGPTP